MANRNTIHHHSLIHRLFPLASDDAEWFGRGDVTVAYVYEYGASDYDAAAELFGCACAGYEER